MRTNPDKYKLLVVTKQLPATNAKSYKALELVKNWTLMNMSNPCLKKLAKK